LPINIGNQFKDIELLIKRKKENEKQTDSTQEQAKAWHLTMKMDISDIGQLLSKAKVLDNGLELSFYSSNDQVKERVIQFIPQLTTRLKQLGIEVIRSDCQLGKIPDSLQKRPYHLFETQA
jgi:flagellar hook-length control protein FliK